MAVYQHSLHVPSLSPSPPPPLPLLPLCVCLSVQVLVCMCVHIHPEDNRGVIFHKLFPLFFETGSLIGLEFARQVLGWLASEPRGPACLHSPAPEIQACAITPGMFYVDSGN